MKCDGRFENCGALHMDEYILGSCAKCKPREHRMKSEITNYPTYCKMAALIYEDISKLMNSEKTFFTEDQSPIYDVYHNLEESFRVRAEEMKAKGNNP